MAGNTKIEALKTIFTICVLRWGRDQDKRFGVAALVTYHVLMGPLKREALTETRQTLQGFKKVMVDQKADAGDIEAVKKNVMVFSQANALLDGLESRRDGMFASFKSKKELGAIAPELLEGIEKYDVDLINNFAR